MVTKGIYTGGRMRSNACGVEHEHEYSNVPMAVAEALTNWSGGDHEYKVQGPRSAVPYTERTNLRPSLSGHGSTFDHHAPCLRCVSGLVTLSGIEGLCGTDFENFTLTPSARLSHPQVFL